MKQPKKTLSSSKASSRQYFNPYEEAALAKKTPRQQSKPYSAEKKNEDAPKKVKKQAEKKVVSKKKGTTEGKKVVKHRTAPSKSQKPAKATAPQTDTYSRQQDTYSTTNSQTLTPEQRRQEMRKELKLSSKQRKQMKRKRRNRMITKIGIAMILTVTLVWGGVALKEYLTKPTISTQIVKVGTLDTSIQLDGVILRNEKVVYSEEEGYVRYVVAEGERIQKDGLVYLLVDEDNLEVTTTAKETVESQIYNQAENIENVSSYQSERYNLDQEVRSKMEEYYNRCYESSTHYIYTLRSQLESSIANRTTLYTKEQETKNDQLVQLKEQIDADISSYEQGQTSSESGIISYFMDGYETEDAVSTMTDLNSDVYNKMKKITTPNALGQGQLQQGAPIYKVILNNDWYVVSEVDTETADSLTVGSEYTLYFDDMGNKSVTFKLEKKDEGEKKTQIIFKTNDQISSFLGSRSIQFSIGEKTTTGLKVPMQAIVEQQLIKIPESYAMKEDTGVYVYRKQGEVTEKVPLTIQYTENENHYIRQNLMSTDEIQVGDTLVCLETGDSLDVAEVVTKKGVFVVNNKVAKFREVAIVVDNGEYAIVKATSKNQLQEMDKIISNPKSIEIDQLLDTLKIQNE